MRASRACQLRVTISTVCTHRGWHVSRSHRVELPRRRLVPRAHVIHPPVGVDVHARQAAELGRVGRHRLRAVYAVDPTVDAWRLLGV